MEKVNKKIVEILKEEMKQIDPMDDYSQWLMGVSVRKNQRKENEDISYTARMVTKTNKSPYVDGMDIEFIEIEGEVTIDPLYYENSPDLMGSPEKDSINWMLKMGDVIYLNSLDPHKRELYLGRLKYHTGKYTFKDLEDYNSFDSHIRNIINLYKALLIDVLLTEDILVSGLELNPGEFELRVIVENRLYILNPSYRYTKEDMVEEISTKIISPIVREHRDKEDSNY